MRSVTPERLSAMKAMPFQPAELIAVTTTTPGVRNSMEGSPRNPGNLDDAREEGAGEEQPDHRPGEGDRDPGRLAQEPAQLARSDVPGVAEEPPREAVGFPQRAAP